MPWHAGTEAGQYEPPCLCHAYATHGGEKEKTMQTMWLLGGLGLGVGLMYLLDPDKGEGRRDRVRGYMVDYGRQTGDFLDDTGRTLGRQAQAVLATSRRPFQRQPGLGERLLAHDEQRGTTTGMVLVGCIGLGIGLGYLLASQESSEQRARLREKVRTYWRPSETRHAPQQELARDWRFFQGRDTHRVDAHTRKPAQAEAWYVEPREYDSNVLYSEPFVTCEEAEEWAKAQGKP
jgi:hypothetical protein